MPIPHLSTECIASTTSSRPGRLSSFEASNTLPHKLDIPTTGFPAPTPSISPALPLGMTLSDIGNGAAIIGGTPLSIDAIGSHSFTITAGSATQSFSLVLDEPAVFSSAPGTTFLVGQIGKLFSIATAPGTLATTTMSESGTLPKGLKFTAGKNGTATISGTAAIGTGGAYDLALVASNGGTKTTQNFTLTVNQTPAFTSAGSATFMEGESGTFKVTTTGFPKPSLQVLTTPLPAGLTFTDNGNGTGTLTGIPEAGTYGKFPITLEAFGLIDVVETLTLTIEQPPLITSADSVAFLTGQNNTFTITTSSFPPATTLTESGALPKGVTFSFDKANGTAILRGTPTTTGAFTLTLTASDGLTPESLQLFTLTVT